MSKVLDKRAAPEEVPSLTADTRRHILVIDDMRTYNANDGRHYTYARTFDKGLTAVMDWMDGIQSFDEIWLDHDLGIDPDPWNAERTQTIRPIVLWLVEEALIFNRIRSSTKFRLITSNPVGRDWMRSQLEKWYEVYV